MRDLPLTFVEDMAHEVLPLDRAGTPESVQAAAQLMAELVRRLNHATLRPGEHTLPAPVDVAALVSALQETLARLPQLLRQIGARLDMFDPAQLRADGFGPVTDPAELASGAAEYLDMAARQTAAVGDHLQSATRYANRLAVAD